MDVIRGILISICIRETETQEEPLERIRENNTLTGVKNRSYSPPVRVENLLILGASGKVLKRL